MIFKINAFFSRKLTSLSCLIYTPFTEVGNVCSSRYFIIKEKFSHNMDIFSWTNTYNCVTCSILLHKRSFLKKQTNKQNQPNLLHLVPEKLNILKSLSPFLSLLYKLLIAIMTVFLLLCYCWTWFGVFVFVFVSVVVILKRYRP